VTGSLVVLTPATDKFRTKAIVATVAARPLDGLRQNPPEIDLFFARAEELEIDPAQEFWMVEHRGSMYEADRHTLLALQRMMREPYVDESIVQARTRPLTYVCDRFPLQEHLIGVQRNVQAPSYVADQPRMDLTSVLINNKHETYENVDILHAWPQHPHSDLDASQLGALHRFLTKRLAIIQGPPGTGKTYISVQAVKIMLANRKDVDPPIIIACQTNHAIDQLLNHIAQFEPDFIRLGGRSKDKGVVKERTLYEVRNSVRENPLAGSLGPQSRKRMKDLQKTIAVLLSPLKDDKTPLDHRLLENLGLLTEQQAESLEEGASEWVQATLTNPKEAQLSPFNVWIPDQLISVSSRQQPEDFDFDYEEADLEYEQLKDMEAENANKDDEDLEGLSGEVHAVADNFTCRPSNGLTEHKVSTALKEEDMWKIHKSMRPAIYRYLQSEMKKIILKELRTHAKKWNELAEQRRIGSLQEHERILKTQKIIGMTTTGLSKYRGLLASLGPKVVLIEEAAEVLEAPVSVACLPSLQHLILVGDHKQLRPHCKVKDHEDKPYYLNVSLFERLVKNKLEYDTLSKQRRMIPEVRRLLQPIYKNILKDHASVLDPAKRPPVPGMGGVNSFFFTHNWPEQRDDQGSAYNPQEADMIVGFVKYLRYNGVATENITVLTFYNGQRKKLLYELRKDAALGGQFFKVVTVDSYQGEENEVVILSLVRSNSRHQIGFLNIDNRVCVALSRAKCGFYLFGNGQLLFDTSETWEKVISILANKTENASDRLQAAPVSRLAEALPLRCSNHAKLTEIIDPDGWSENMGGCQEKCGGLLPCGHPCVLTCHPFSHDMVNCFERCKKKLTCCGKPCQEPCGASCACKSCCPPPAEDDPPDTTALTAANLHNHGYQSSAAHWQSFATEAPKRYAEEVASINSSRRTSPEKSNNSTKHTEASIIEPMKDLSIAFGDTDVTPQSQAHRGAAPREVAARGGRKKWTSVPSMPKSSQQSMHKKDWSKAGSLLD
jgi:helicase required for RNAi-mediated heterochromatin assembly 1